MDKDELESKIKRTLSHFNRFRYESITVGSNVDPPKPQDPVVVELSYRGPKSIDPRVFDKIEGRLRSNLHMNDFSVTSRDKECELWVYLEEDVMRGIIED